MISLKNVMVINAVSSGATGAGLLFASNLIANLFGTDRTSPFIVVGLFLLVFSTVVYQVSRKLPTNLVSVRVIITADLLWVASSVIIVLFHVFMISTIGYLLISAVAIWVAAMAYLQFSGLNQIIKSN